MKIVRLESVSFVGAYFVLYPVGGGLQVVPLVHFPPLQNQLRERETWELHDEGTRIHWPELEYSLTVPELLKVSLPL